jgi:hypothetical protein
MNICGQIKTKSPALEINLLKHKESNQVVAAVDDNVTHPSQRTCASSAFFTAPCTYFGAFP